MTASTRGALVAVAAALVISLISLCFTHAIAYDPEAWIVWSRELVGPGVLSTWDGPTWKPLPIILIAPFTWISRGEADVYYWLTLERAGAILGAIGVAAAANRLGGRTAALIAAVLIIVSPWWFYNGILGNAEPAMVGVLAAAVYAHHRKWFAAAGFFTWAAGLIRPEIWVFGLLYAAWLVWERRAQRRAQVVVIAVAAVAIVTTLVAWNVPTLLHTGGSTLGSAQGHGAAGSASYGAIPFLQVFRDTFSQLTVLPTVLALAGALSAIWVARHQFRAGGAAAVTTRVRYELLLSIGAVVYLVIVGVMTQAGFSGNLRYLIPALAASDVLAAVTAARLAGLLAGLLGTRVSGRADRSAKGPPLLATSALAIALVCVSAFLISWSTLRTERANVSGHANLAKTMRTQLAEARCPGVARTYGNVNSTLAQITGQSLAQSTKPITVPGRRHKFVYCAPGSGQA